MKKILKWISILLFALLLTNLPPFFSHSTIYDISDNLRIVKIPPLEQRILSQMSLEQKIGQLFVFGFNGTSINKNITQLIQNQYIGGVLLLEPNIENNNQLSNLLSDIQNISYIPLLVCIDQEGGIVARLSGDKILTKAQKDMKNEQEAYTISNQRGEILSSLGINTNLAPVVEYITSSKSFMYQRVFRGTKEEVALKSKAAIQGYIDSGIVSVAKHYPGHSNSSPDSHYSLPKVNITTQQWDEYIFPFKYLVEEKIPDVIMVGHILYPNIDSKPSTISSEIIQKRLRQDLGYSGVIITDDMEMDSIEKVGEYNQIAKEALLAGVDILLYSGIPNVQRDVYQYIFESTSNGEIAESIINEKVLRILSLKIKYGLIDSSILQPQEEEEVLSE